MGGERDEEEEGMGTGSLDPFCLYFFLSFISFQVLLGGRAHIRGEERRGEDLRTQWARDVRSFVHSFREKDSPVIYSLGMFNQRVNIYIFTPFR